MQIIIIIIIILVSFSHSWAGTIAVFFALDADVDSLYSTSVSPQISQTIGSRKIYRSRVAGHEVIAVKMGSGCVETALSAQALLARFSCDLAISIGPAGALNDFIKTGRWYRVNQVVASDKGTESYTGPRLHLNSRSEVPISDVDSNVVLNFRLDNEPTSLASGEKFIASQSAREKLHQSTGASLVDMNSYGLVAACADHNVPLYIFRVVSDNADEQAGETFRAFAENYDGEGGALAAEIVKNLPPNPEEPGNYEEIRKVLGRP